MANAGNLTILVTGDTSQLTVAMREGIKVTKQMEAQADRLSRSLLEEERVLRMGADGANDFKLALAGVSKETRDGIAGQREVVEQLKRQAEAAQIASAELFRLQDAINAAKSGEDAAATSRLAASGVSAEDIAAIQKLQGELAKLRAEDEQFARAMSAERSAIDARNAELAEGAAITQSVRTDTERYADEVARLNKLLSTSAINQETFNRALRRAKEAAGSGLDRINSPFERLKRQLGSRGPLKDLAEIAVGGGAFAGVQFLTQELARALKATEDIVTQFRLGEKSAGDVADQIARSLPYLGGIYSAGRSIRELITGEAAEIEKINRQVAEVEQRLKTIKDFRLNVKKITEDAQNDIESLNRQIRDLRIELEQDPKSVDASKLEAQLNDSIDGLMKKRQVEVDALLQVGIPADEKTGLARDLADLKSKQKKLVAPNPIPAPVAMAPTAGTGLAGADLAALQDRELLAADIAAKNQKAISDYNAEVERIANAIKETERLLKDSTDAVTKSIDDQIAAMRKKYNLEKQLRTRQGADAAAADVIKGAQQIREDLDRQRREYQESVKRDAEEVKRRGESIADQLATPQEAYEKRLAELKELLDKNAITTEVYQRGVKQAGETLKSELDDVSKLQAAFADLESGSTGVADALSQQITATFGNEAKNDIEKQMLNFQKRTFESIDKLEKKISVGSN